MAFRDPDLVNHSDIRLFLKIRTLNGIFDLIYYSHNKRSSIKHLKNTIRLSSSLELGVKIKFCERSATRLVRVHAKKLSTQAELFLKEKIRLKNI